MTWDYLERHLVTLTTIGPVSIASGRELSKKEYILDRKRQEAVILDERKLFSYLKRRGLLESFERYMLGGRGDLFHWAREERVYPEDAGQIEKYRLDCSAITEINTVKNMMTFMKDAYGLPYVPGSSIKGALRNVILARMIEEEPDRELAETIRNTVSDRSIRGGKQLLRRESRDLEAGYLYTLDRLPDRPRSVLNDRMAGVRVADSPALSTDCLTLCQKIDEDTGAACRPLPIVRECLKPGTVIRAVLTLDRSLTDLSIESIREAIRSFNERYNREYLSRFPAQTGYDGDVIYLGGGAGFHSKTVTSALFTPEESLAVTAEILDRTLPPRMQREHKHYRDVEIGASPHVTKVTQYAREYYPFGPCRIEFEPMP